MSEGRGLWPRRLSDGPSSLLSTATRPPSRGVDDVARSFTPVSFQGLVNEGSWTTAAGATGVPLSTFEEEETSRVLTSGRASLTPTEAPEQAVTSVSIS